MIDVEKIDIERLKNPTPLYRLLDPKPEKLDAFADKLLNGYLYFSDEFRDAEYLKALVYDLYSRRTFNIIYEMGDFKGVIGFTDVIFSHKAEMMLKMWDASIWGPDAVGQCRQLIEYIIETFKLSRVGTMTADPRVVRMAKLVGFTEEGVLRSSFKWNGKLRDETLLSITRG
jgi:RimJ/RimL family protein N-acetyltransferase